MTRLLAQSELQAALVLLPMLLAVFSLGGLGSLLINQPGPRLLILGGGSFLVGDYYLLGTLDLLSNFRIIRATLVCGQGFGIICGQLMF
ncbi:hypothetical protein HU830_06135 [Lactobacillus sp. DCY120]|uniref:Uncharacterized protein n=1 Tax=Bombilactobacillus apium TaxID=2675299 RepID=A0A850R1D4_9LACO|nr:hypothetical protein [Bombilactobacillus apium]NVY96733.1 hypothetical protein [Bombilactobacillus apium]